MKKLAILVLLFGFSQASIGRFWHITDFHLDTNYTTNGNPDIMCWNDTASNTSSVPGEFGSFQCDSPQSLVESAIAAMVSIEPNPHFIIWTGDDTAHVDNSFFSVDKVVDIISQLSDLIRTAFPHTMVVPVLGNHDLYPKNQLSPGPSELQSKVANVWKDWLDVFGAYQNFSSVGYYSAEIPGSNLTILGLNTLLWYRSNDFTNSLNDSDPAGQFLWIEETLQDIEESNRKASIIGHIPPGTFERYTQKREGFHWLQERFNLQYIQMVNDYYPTIASQLFAHHHTDSFRVFSTNTTGGISPLSYLLLAPGVSPMRSTLSPETGANNPGIRLISYDTETGEIVESSTYFLDLNEANLSGETSWKFEYNLTSMFDLQNVSAESLYEAAMRMQSDDQLFDQYFLTNTVQWSDPLIICNNTCKTTQICAITQLDYDDFYNCNA